MCAVCIQKTDSSYDFVKMARESMKMESSFVAISVPIRIQPAISNTIGHASSFETESKSESGVSM